MSDATQGMAVKVAAAGAVAGLVGFAISKFCVCSGDRKRVPVALKGREKVMLRLSDVEVLNHNTKIFTFALPTAEHVLGLPIGKHVSLSTKIDGKPVQRAYTPISCDQDVGIIRLAVKVYEQGKMTQHLDKMQVGDELAFAGPNGEFHYLGRGEFTLTKRGETTLRSTKCFVGMAGGSGLTPLLQVMQEIARDPADATKFHLVFGNVTEDDILLRGMLDDLVKQRPDQFTVWHTLDKPPAGWAMGSGYITETMLAERFGCTGGSAPEDQFALMCGPPPMIKFACKPNLEKLGYKPENTFCF
eukprot:TRINITY_DN22165_c0_g1_i1.p2 TRINITY_DN22165_c0_g1~~TRINITY_DN22165_c0_g1_i1.p2  ORF type:complete len:301 (+),score=124.70 TRINITY_DN22165_c0_g1_i1:57-959(+)